MIVLHEDKKYFTIEDGQGARFGAGRIFEGEEELKNQFREWADMDGYEDTTLKGWTIADCLENWVFTLWVYDGLRWLVCEDEKVLNYK